MTNYLDILNNTDPQRKPTFAKAIELYLDLTSPCGIVETGSFRGYDHTDGNSTALFAALAIHIGTEFTSIDVNPQHSEIAMQMLKQKGLTGSDIVIETADSINFLSDYIHPISLLYLDSLDYNPAEYLKSQIHQLAELAVAFNKLTSKAVVLLDDCHLPDGGKGALATSFLLSRGFELVLHSYQSLFYRK